jgi:exonuclease III
VKLVTWNVNSLKMRLPRAGVPRPARAYDPAAFAGSTHVTPEERSRIEAILAAGGLVDAYRERHPGEVQHTP